MSYILDMLICVSMILLDNLLQYLMFIVVIDLSKTYDIIAILIYNVIFDVYLKMTKLKFMCHFSFW
jgi:hypothetical protein